jgi:O-succinylbenzoate synthase
LWPKIRGSTFFAAACFPPARMEGLISRRSLRSLLALSRMPYLLQFRRYALPFQAPVRTAHGRWTVREGLAIRLEDEAGVAGYGEAGPVPDFGGETMAEITAACRELGDRVDDARLDAVPARLGSLTQALAAARRRGAAEPRQKHLGVAALLPAGGAALAQVRTRAEAGFRVFKWKVGVGDVDDELAMLDDLCAVLPGGAQLRLDANGAWDRRRAERWLERCAERPVEFVEQPCFAEASQGATGRSKVEDILLGLAGDYPTTLALDESLVNGGDIERWLGLGWPGVFVLKPLLLGGIDGVLTRLSAAKAKVVFSSALETGIGAKAALQAAFSWPGETDSAGSLRTRSLGFGVWPLFADARYDGPTAAPFLHWEDVQRINPEAIWTALS